MVEVKGLTKTYGEFLAIRDVSFHVKSSECFALLGPNGSGKTTTLKCLAGLAIAKSGTVRIGGMDVVKNARSARILLSYLPQRVAFYDNLTVRETLEFYSRLRDVEPKHVARVMEELGLGAIQNKSVGELSGGMVQRLGIAVALLPEAPLLLLDEPAVGLDPEGAIRFRELLRTLNRAGKTIIFSSHVLSDVKLLADRVAVIVGGRLVAVQSADRIENGFGAAERLRISLRIPEPRFVDIALHAGGTDARLVHDTLIVSCAPAARLPVLQALESAGADIERFFTEEPDLEEVYLRFVNENTSGVSRTDTGSLHGPPASAG
jgi:ABC-type multidrug transport system ATPase subunit